MSARSAAARFVLALLRLAGIGTLLIAAPAVSQSSPSDFTSAARYDLMHRVVGTIAPDPDGTGPLHYAAVRNTYDAAGNLVRVEKGELTAWQSEAVMPSAWPVWNGSTGFHIFTKTEISYDVMDRKTVEANWGWDAATSAWIEAEVLQYSYDSIGRLECIAQRMNAATWGSLPTSACTLGATGSFGPDRVTKRFYDAAGQLLKVQKGYGVTVANGFPADLQQDYVSYSYSANGKQLTVIDANGNQAKYTYDGFDRQTAWYFPSTTTPGAASTTDYEAYGYDANGNRTSLRKRDARTIGYTYDALNRVTSKTLAGGACVSGYACSAPPSGSVRDVYSDYDLRGLQTGAHFDTATGADAVVNAFDGFGRLTTSAVSMGGVSRTVAHQYDADGNRIRVTHPDGNYFTYDYDGLDRSIAIRENGVAQVASFGYDAQGRKASEARGAVLTTYGYDAVSRLTGLSDDLAGTTNDVTATFAYNPANQIVTETRDNALYAFNAYATASNSYTANELNQYTAVGAGTLGYDSNGNLMSNGGTTFAYDVENRLVAASGTLSAALVYDPLGRLFSTAGRQYLYDGDELIGEFNGAGPLVKRYVHGNSEDDPLLWYAGAGLGTRYSLQADHQGSIVSIADATGAILAAPNSYDEYGVPGNGNVGTFQYTGQMYLPQLGMYYYKARIYSSRLGRFLQTDPIGYKDQVNLYEYVGDDPIDGRDPTGLDGSNEHLEDVLKGRAAPAVSPQQASALGKLARSAFNFVRAVFSDQANAARARDAFRRNYQDMRDANTIGGDKYFHCKANCEAASLGHTGEVVAQTVSNIREATDQRIKGDPRSASEADQAANHTGRAAGARAATSPMPQARPSARPGGPPAQTVCQVACSSYRPNGLSEKY